MAANVSLKGDQTIQGSASVGLGGAGGSGGVAGNVTVTPDTTGNSLTISTLGHLSKGFVAQSIGGGGGTGGSASSTSYNKSKSKYTFGASANASGEGGTGGNSGVVTVGETSLTPLNLTITTKGDSAEGFLAQSVGGGGGTGGGASTNNQGGSVNATFAMGARGGAGGNAGAVIVNTLAGIKTFGANAMGFVAQSIGGGGGSGGSTVSQSESSAPDSKNSKSSTFQFGCCCPTGGSGGAGGDAGSVTVSFGGAVRTAGHASDGIYVQSVGGGGGIGGSTISSASSSGGSNSQFGCPSAWEGTEEPAAMVGMWTSPHLPQLKSSQPAIPPQVSPCKAWVGGVEMPAK